MEVVEANAIINHDFSEGLLSWHPNSCNGFVSDGSDYAHEINAESGNQFAVVSNRTQCWQGLEQNITSKLLPHVTYNVLAVVRVWGSAQQTADVLATLRLENPNSAPTFLSVGRVTASREKWERLEGTFSLNSMPCRAIFYLEGPLPGLDLLIDRVHIWSAIIVKNPAFGLNILENSNLFDGLRGWYPLGSCSLNVATGSPHTLPPAAQESLGWQQSLSGNYILVTNRTQTWEGPAQTFTEKLKLFATYQVTAWVRVGSGGSGAQNVNVAISVDGRWVNGGEVEADVHLWREVAGSFRLESKPSNVMVYVQGPSPGVDLMVAGLQIFPVDHKARFKHLKKRTEKLRKRDVILNISGGSALDRFCGFCVKVKQTYTSFPLGSCINRSGLDNDDYVAFFVKNFNWAVFENELKWSWTEPQKGNYNYRDSDDLLEFCKCHGIQTRGHCIFWEDSNAVQQWVKELNQNDLRAAVEKRISDLLSRYRGKFQHYDVNNEMLHGSFYQNRLGKDIWSYMFKMAHQVDPSAILFVNDYHVEDGADAKSTPEKYINQIVDLQERGAPVGGIGIQGHITYPVGSVVHTALDAMSILGLPIWFTEMDVYSTNEFVRADDLEIMLREAFAHPAVEGIMFWGFWEFMSRGQGHLVDWDGAINEAGKRFISLKKEWTTHLKGHTDREGQFKFRGFHGTYEVEVSGHSRKTRQTFTVDKGDSPIVVEISL